MDQRASEGRIVHYVLKEGRSAGQHRAAMVVNAHGGNTTHLNLHVYLDGYNDSSSEFEAECLRAINSGGTHTEPMIGHAYSAEYDAEGKKPGSWHWPERV